MPTSIYPSLRTDKVADDLGLVDKGRECGKNNEPPTESQTLDDIEHLIVDRIELEKRSAHAIYSDQIQTYAERMTSLDFEGRFSAIRQAAPQAVGDFRAEAAQGRDELYQLRRRVIDTKQDRDLFRGRHNLERSARISTAATQLFK